MDKCFGDQLSVTYVDALWFYGSSCTHSTDRSYILRNARKAYAKRNLIFRCWEGLQQTRSRDRQAKKLDYTVRGLLVKKAYLQSV